MNFNASLMSVLRKLIAKETIYLRQYEGTVIDDQDPKSLGRLKIQIPELLWETANTIPWAYPEHGLNTAVPPKGKSAVVYFLKGNEDHPVYRGGTSERADTQLKEYKNPNTVVIFEDDNILFLWDRTKKAFTIKINNNEIKFDNKNNLEINAAVKVTVNAPQVIITGGQLLVNGMVTPNGQGGFCGMTNCAFSGAPHIGNSITNT